MLKFFKKKSKVEKLEIQYKQLMEASYKLSHTNRKESDQKRGEAEHVYQEIERLKKSE